LNASFTGSSVSWLSSLKGISTVIDGLLFWGVSELTTPSRQEAAFSNVRIISDVTSRVMIGLSGRGEQVSGKAPDAGDAQASPNQAGACLCAMPACRQAGRSHADRQHDACAGRPDRPRITLDALEIVTPGAFRRI